MKKRAFPLDSVNLLSKVHDAVIVTDLNGVIQTWNAGARRLYGYEESEAAGQSVAILYFPEDLPLLETAVLTPLKTTDLHEVRLRQRRNDGKEIFIALRVSVIRDAGTPIGYVGCSNDITKRKRSEDVSVHAHAELEARVEERTKELAEMNARLLAQIAERSRMEAELHASRERLKHLLLSAPGVIYSCRPSGDFGATFLSDNAAGLFGYSPEDFTGDSSFWANHVHPEDRDHVLKASARIGEQGQVNHEYRFLHRDGTYRWVRDSAALVRDEAGAPIEIVGYWSDMTEAKLAEEARREREKMQLLADTLLVTLETERTRISRELHDNLNQHLAAIILDIGLLERKLPASLGSIRQGLRNLKQRAGGVSDEVHRIALRLHSATLEQFGLQGVLESECAAFSERTGIELAIECRRIPQELSYEIALCLYRVAQECLANIASHSRTRRATVTLEGHDSGIRLRIEDFGCGFDPSAVADGRRLGIISMTERVRLAKGVLSLDSSAGRGTRVEAWIPVPGAGQ